MPSTPPDPPCAQCAARGPVTTIRDHFVPGHTFDATLGLRAAGGERFVCPHCGTRYRRTVTHAAEFEDHDRWFFTKLPAGD